MPTKSLVAFQSLNFEQKEYVKRRLKKWVTLATALSIFTIFLNTVVLMRLPEIMDFLNEDYLFLIYVITGIIALLFFASSVNFCVSALLYYDLYGKFDNYVVAIILGTLMSSGVGLLFAYINRRSKRKALLRVVKKNVSGSMSEAFSHINPLDLMTLGYEYANGENGKVQDEKKAISYFRQAANLGHPSGFLELGFHAEDNGQFKDAVIFYQRAFELGSPRGAYFIARMIEKGHGYQPSEKDALEWYEKAAVAGESLSQYYIGIAYITGKYTPQDVNKGLSFLEQSANQNEYDALFYLGVRHGAEAKHNVMNPRKAETYFARAIKAAKTEGEVAEAYNELGRLWIKSWEKSGRQEHYRMALQLFDASSKLGSEDAKTNFHTLVSMRDNEYQSIESLMSKDLVPAYINRVIENTSSSVTTTSPESYYPNPQAQSSFSTKELARANPVANQDIVLELRSLSKQLLISIIIKSICFGVGLGIIFWGRNQVEQLGVLLPLLYIGGIVVAGLPGLFRSFVGASQYTDKWNRFFGRAEYKAAYDSNSNTVKIRKNTDWASVIFITLMNVFYVALFTPFVIFKEIIQIIMVRIKIKKAATTQE